MKQTILLLAFLVLIILLASCTEKESTEVETIIKEKDTPNKLYVYPNIGNSVFLVDYETFEVIKEIKIDIPDSLGLFGITLSTNRDYLIFSGMQLEHPYEHFILSYNISEDTIRSFTTGLNTTGAPRLTPALDQSNIGHIYFYTHTHGLYLFDFLEQKVEECISPEHGQSLSKRIYNTPNRAYTAVLRKSGNPRYSQIEFYQQDSFLQNLLFIFNKNDEYDMSVYDVAFSENDEFMYVSYQLSESRSRDIESYFGIYDLNKKQLFKSEMRLPWSLNPYYIEYSPKRNEAYLIGAYDQFYIINTESNTLIDSVTITGKVEGPSRILTDPDEDVAFVSCSRTDKIAVIDLDNRKVISNIQISRPYKMIIP